MKLKPLIISVLVLAAISAGVFLMNRPSPPASADPRVGQPLVERSVAEKASQVRISDAGKVVTITRQPDATWIVTEYHGLPADFKKLTKFVADLTDAKLQRFVTANPDRLARLDFKDTKITLLDSAGAELWSVTLGKNAGTGGGRYVKFGDEQKAFLTSLSAWLDTTPKNWADAQILDLKPETIAKVEIPFPEGGPVTVSRAKAEEPWKSDQIPDGQQVNPGKITSTIRSLGSLRFSDTVDTTDPQIAEAMAHERTFKFTTFDEKTYTVSLGRKPEEKKLKPPAPEPPKTETAAGASPATPGKAAKPAKPATPAKPPAPEYETIPAGPVFVSISSSDSAAEVNALMKKRGFEVSEYVFTQLPQKAADLFEPAPKPAPAGPAKPAEPTAPAAKAPPPAAPPPN